MMTGDAAVTEAELFEGAEAVHDRHLDVEKDQVGTDARDHFERGGAIAGGAGYLKSRIGADDTAQQGAHDG